MRYVKGIDNKPLYMHEWRARPERRIILVIHGMSEHGGRYERMARYLNRAGISVCAVDLRGFGQTLNPGDQYGWMVDEDAFRVLMYDMQCLVIEMQKGHTAPLILMGHSMGSVIVMSFLQRRYARLEGCILSGIPEIAPWKDLAGNVVARLQSFFISRFSPGLLHHQLSFVAWNKKFKPNRTAFDWLSRDSKEVDAYVQDPLCGGMVPVRLFSEVQQNNMFNWWGSQLKRMQRDLPLLYFAGSEDPVVGGAKGFAKQVAAFQNFMTDFHYKLYEGARHECLNETNRDEVMQDILEFCMHTIPYIKGSKDELY
ncbi:MAG: lysophospholipase [Flavobacteriales bacterium]|nr:lysophospholipase [Flavobacteriales bacterium]